MHLPGIDVLEPIGGTGRVHRAVDRRSGRVVAVKAATSDRPDDVAALRREAHVLRTVEHPGLVRLLDVVEGDDGVCLVLDHAAGGSLADLLRARGRLEPATAAALGAQVADALAALHGRGVVHRDVSCTNVLLDAEQQPLLCDLDRALDPTAPPAPGDARAVGTPGSVDPAAVDGEDPTPLHDLYGLGCVLWEALTGAPPHGAPGDDDLAALDAARRAQRPALHAVAPVDPDLAALVEDLLRRAVPDAVTAARRLAAAADTATAPSSPSARHASTRGRTREWGPRPPGPAPVAPPPPTARWRAAAVALVLVLLLGPVLAGLRPGHGSTVTPPPPCGTSAAPTAGGRALVRLADLDGDGCGEALVHDPVAALLSLPDGTRFALGEPGDVLLLGDWDGDGSWTPALHRTSAGRVFLFDRLASDAPLASRPGVPVGDGRARVVDVDGDGRHEVQVGETVVPRASGAPPASEG